ncbi:non-canonical purine NTP diphosphatase [soil metagenome]
MAQSAIKLVIASNNQHKVNEIRESAPPGFIFSTLNENNFTMELPETTGTINGNALQKARTFWKLTGLNCLADDSGLIIHALDGRPGVDSAFYAGLPRNDSANINKVLTELIEMKDRSAYFITIMALIINGKEHIFEGVIKGNIANSPIGDHGFGYDPIFIPDGENRTFAQMSSLEKNAMSHRSRALRLVVKFLEEQLHKDE